MQIKIRDNAKEHYIRRHMVPNSSYPNWDWADVLGILEGRILDVETEFLFQDQFNTAGLDYNSVKDLLPDHKSQQVKDKLKSGCGIGWRIMAESVDYVINDERHGKMRCGWCGKTNDQAYACPDCGKQTVKWFYIFDDKVPSTQMIDPPVK